MKILRLIFSIIITATLIHGENPSSVRAMPFAVAPTVIHVPGDAATLEAAVTMVNNGNIIQLAGGTYTAPAGGWLFNNLGKGFTVRAASGATVILSGGGTTSIVHQMNSSLSNGRPIIYQNLIFANGYSTVDNLAGGVTLQRAEATFINCTFQNNTGINNWGGAGGTVVSIDSTAFFFNTIWTGNSDKSAGGGLAVTDHAKVFIHNSRFTNNRTNYPNHSTIAAGGGIYVTNATLRVSNTRFDSNQAGYVGGAIYSFGTWGDATGSDIIIANCTFENNQAARDASVSFFAPTEAGAFHAEDLTTAKIYNSRFITNSSMTGAGVNLYRANVEIYDSVFQGNRVSASPGFGGAISAISNDTSADGGTNRRPASVKIYNSFIQGRYGSTTIAAQTAGGIYAAGDGNRMYGQNGVSQNGTAAQNRATVVVNNVVFYDLDVQEISGVPGSGVGGAMTLDLADLTMQNSSILNSDAIGSTNSSGGGMAILNQSLANISDSIFGRNTTQMFGGAIFSQLSSLFLTNSKLIENSSTSAYGSAIFIAMNCSVNLPANGVVQSSVFSNNSSLPMIWDGDCANGPSNDIQYNTNQFYDPSGVNALVYYDPLAGSSKSASQLNSLIISRSNGSSTDKGSGNSALSSAPKVGMILAVPPQILATNANGDSAPPTLAYVGYAWSGASATLDGGSVSGNAGATAASLGTHTLSVGGTDFTASISQAPTPAATFTASGSSPVTLNWATTAGIFLDVAIDHGVTIPSTSSGSVQVSPPVDTDYWLYVITKEGGFVKSVNTGLPILNVPATVYVLAGQNYPVNKGYFMIKNDGGGTLDWTATSQTLSLITMDTSSGQTPIMGTVGFAINIGSLSPGDYVGTINVDAGVGGTSQVTVNVKLVGILYKVQLPLVIR